MRSHAGIVGLGAGQRRAAERAIDFYPEHLTGFPTQRGKRRNGLSLFCLKTATNRAMLPHTRPVETAPVFRDVQNFIVLLAWLIRGCDTDHGHECVESRDLQEKMRSTKVLLAFGIPPILFTGMLATRIVWEETFLTIKRGPQMIGFSLAHGAGGNCFLPL
jgi:hypothetical protein